MSFRNYLLSTVTPLYRVGPIPNNVIEWLRKNNGILFGDNIVMREVK